MPFLALGGDVVQTAEAGMQPDPREGVIGGEISLEGPVEGERDPANQVVEGDQPHPDECGHPGEALPAFAH